MCTSFFIFSPRARFVRALVLPRFSCTASHHCRRRPGVPRSVSPTGGGIRQKEEDKWRNEWRANEMGRLLHTIGNKPGEGGRVRESRVGSGLHGIRGELLREDNIRLTLLAAECVCHRNQDPVVKINGFNDNCRAETSKSIKRTDDFEAAFRILGATAENRKCFKSGRDQCSTSASTTMIVPCVHDESTRYTCHPVFSSHVSITCTPCQGQPVGRSSPRVGAAKRSKKGIGVTASAGRL